MVTSEIIFPDESFTTVSTFLLVSFAPFTKLVLVSVVTVLISPFASFVVATSCLFPSATAFDLSDAAFFELAVVSALVFLIISLYCPFASFSNVLVSPA